MKKEYLVIGAGFSGATLARQLADAGNYVTVVDSRTHVAGNAYDAEWEETGIRYHVYGPHLFHTNNEAVFNWLSQFTQWTPYHHRVMAQLSDGQYVPFPPNKHTFEFFEHDRNRMIDVFFRPYTRKMWGMEMEEIDPNVIARVPMDPDTEDNRYFKKDKFQYLPVDGYTAMVKNILRHPNIFLSLYTPIKRSNLGLYRYFDHVFNCAPIDVWFNFEFGELPYRSIKFQHVYLPMHGILPSPVVNFTHNKPQTRVTEWTKLPFHSKFNNDTLLTFETPCDYKDNDFERYYPVKDVHGVNRANYEKYKAIVPDNMTFIGRCGQYVYIDMDQAVNASLQLAKKFT